MKITQFHWLDTSITQELKLGLANSCVMLCTLMLVLSFHKTQNRLQNKKWVFVFFVPLNKQNILAYPEKEYSNRDNWHIQEKMK